MKKLILIALSFLLIGMCYGQVNNNKVNYYSQVYINTVEKDTIITNVKGSIFFDEQKNVLEIFTDDTNYFKYMLVEYIEEDSNEETAAYSIYDYGSKVKGYLFVNHKHYSFYYPEYNIIHMFVIKIITK